MLIWEAKFPKMALWCFFISCHCQQKGEKKKKKLLNNVRLVQLRRANI